jgi:hypothetical protein
MASVYALRLFIRAMHNRVGPHVSSRELALGDRAVLVPLVAAILFLALYPQAALHRSEGSVDTSLASTRAALREPSQRRAAPEAAPAAPSEGEGGAQGAPEGGAEGEGASPEARGTVRQAAHTAEERIHTR